VIALNAESRCQIQRQIRKSESSKWLVLSQQTFDRRRLSINIADKHCRSGGRDGSLIVPLIWRLFVLPKCAFQGQSSTFHHQRNIGENATEKGGRRRGRN
jgi:hypothetical protein